MALVRATTPGGMMATSSSMPALANTAAATARQSDGDLGDVGELYAQRKVMIAKSALHMSSSKLEDSLMQIRSPYQTFQKDKRSNSLTSLSSTGRKAVVDANGGTVQFEKPRFVGQNA